MPLLISSQPSLLFLIALCLCDTLVLPAQFFQRIDEVGRAQVEMSRHAAAKQAHMSRCDQLGAGNVAQFAHDAFEESISRIAVTARSSQSNTVTDSDALGAGVVE